MRKAGIISALAATAAGLCHWYAAGLAQRLAARAFARAFGGGLAALFANLAIEELLRLALVGGAAYALRLSARRSSARAAALPAMRPDARLFAFALLAGLSFGSMENLSYLAAFPSLDTFWRVGYSLPIHINAGLLFALAFFPLARGEGLRPAAALAVAGAFALATAWHGAFNAFASFGFFSALPVLGSALNAAAFAALALLLERNLLLTGVFHGRTRA